MLAHCLRRWPIITPALRHCLVLTGLLAHTATRIYNTFCDRNAHHVSGRCLDSIATIYLTALLAHGPACGNQSWLAKQGEKFVIFIHSPAGLVELEIH